MTRLQLEETIVHPSEPEKAARCEDPDLLNGYKLRGDIDRKLAYGINNLYIPDCEELLKSQGDNTLSFGRL
jgi:hypothetical protein